MIQRMIRAALLDGRMYLELRYDTTATKQALWVMVIVGIALAVGGMRVAAKGGFGAQVQVFALSLSSVVVEWAVLSLLAYLIGKWLLRRTATFPSLLRTIGFANAPGVLYVLAFLGPPATNIITVVILLWLVATMVLALHHTLEVPFLASFWMSTVAVFLALSIRQVFGQAPL